MDYNSLVPLVALVSLIFSGIAIFISVYNFYQSIRKMEVDLWFDNEDKPKVSIYAYNPGQRPVTLIKFKYTINGKPSDIREGLHETDPSKYDGASAYNTGFDKKIDFPYVLKGGEAVFITQNAMNLAGTLHYKDFSGKIKLSAYFETTQKKIYKSKSIIDFDIEKYRIIS